jgi:hypothetical protein
MAAVRFEVSGHEVGGDEDVVVDEKHDFARGLAKSGVPRGRRARILLPQEAESAA